MQTVVLGIAGMSCQSCVNSVTQVLAAIPGVAEVGVSLSAAQATVSFDPARATVADLLQAVADAGFNPS